MNVTRIAVNSILLVIAVLMAFWLFDTIRDPIKFNNERTLRRTAVIAKLENIKLALKTYYKVHEEYPDNWDDLIYSINNDYVTDLSKVKVVDTVPLSEIGDRETIWIDSTAGFARIEETAIEEVLKPFPDYAGFSADFDPNTIQEIPFSNGAEFHLQTGEVLANEVWQDVFQVIATEKQFLVGLDERFISNDTLKLGDLTKFSESGNWEF